MDAKGRREKIADTLKASHTPITGTELARRLHVSRQVIVGDIALLRAGGMQIYATPAGYLLPDGGKTEGARRVIAACHLGEEALLDELLTVTALNGVVEDVSIEHKLYGEFRATLMIRDRAGAEGFVKRMRESGMEPMSLLTGGVHLHTIAAKDEEALNQIEEALLQKGYLLKE